MIIILNGSINAGKSTIANLLAKSIPKSIVLEIDVLRDFIIDVPLEKSIPINLENAVLLSKNFIKHGFNVIIPYPLSQKNIDFLIKKLNTIKIYVFTLDPTKDVALSGRGRILNDWEKERIVHHYKIGINKPNSGIVIDNSKQTPKETVHQILEFIK